MTVLFGADQQVGKWVADRLGYRGFAGNFLGAIASVRNGEILGATVFHNHYPHEGVVEMTSASVSPAWLSRAMIRAIFTYVFDVLRCQLVVMRVGQDNAPMIEIANRFGFKGHFIDRLRGRSNGEWIYTLNCEQWAESRFNLRRKEVSHG